MATTKCKCGRVNVAPVNPVQLRFNTFTWRARLRLIWAVLRGETVTFS